MTFHVRLVSTPGRTGGLLEALACDPGVSSLVVLPGAARQPDGDAVQFDVRPGSANSVFRNLKTFTDGHRDGVAVEYVDATLGEQPAPASRHLVLQRDLAPVWDLPQRSGSGRGRGLSTGPRLPHPPRVRQHPPLAMHGQVQGCCR